jgi:hypothetical protein
MGSHINGRQCHSVPMTVLFRRSEDSKGVPGVAYRVGSTSEPILDVMEDFGAAVEECGLVITGMPGEPGALPGSSPDARYGLWVPAPLAARIEAKIIERNHQIIDE